MANTDNILSFVAAEAITEYAIVSLNSPTNDGKIVITDAATDAKVVGVAQRACASGESVEVMIHGVTRVIASEPITFNSTPLLAAAADGKVQPEFWQMFSERPAGAAVPLQEVGHGASGREINRQSLDSEIKKLAAEKSISYSEALNQFRTSNPDFYTKAFGG